MSMDINTLTSLTVVFLSCSYVIGGVLVGLMFHLHQKKMNQLDETIKVFQMHLKALTDFQVIQLMEEVNESLNQSNINKGTDTLQ